MLVSYDHMTLSLFHILVCKQNVSMKYSLHDFYNDFNFAKTNIRFANGYHLYVVSPPVAALTQLVNATN